MTDRYPLRVVRQSGRADSVSGGKEYHLVKIESMTGKGAIVINRWGKAGAWGTGFRVDRYDVLSDATDAYERKWREKLGGQYEDHFLDKITICNNDAELRGAIAPYLLKMKPEDIKWLSSTLSTAGARPQENAEWETDQFGRNKRVEPPRRLVEEPEEPIAARVLDNPNWGLF